MFVELIEHLRCPRPHAESPLVASSSRSDERHIIEGVLGCPVCNAEFPITGGVARFGEPRRARSTPADAETAMRLAAFLELTDPRGFALLCGAWAAHTDAVALLAETPLVLVNPPTGASVESAAGILFTDGIVPFASGAARAAAVDAAVDADSAVAVVRAGGRVLGPSELDVPAGVTEIVRDERMWVAEKTAAPNAAPRLVSIRKGSR
jgi:uncharacterized protein YbaR (Trm112 family)